MSEKTLFQDEKLNKYNTFGVGGYARYVYIPDNEENLLNTLKEFKKIGIKYLVIGNGSNILLPDDNFNGVVISLKRLNSFKIDSDICTVGAGLTLPALNAFLMKEEYTNFAPLSMIPGTIGGSIKGNAEAFKYAISTDLISIDVIKDLEFTTIEKEDIDFKYRESSLGKEIILSAKFKVVKGDLKEAKDNITTWKKFRDDNQPYDKKSAGSTFRNPEGHSAGKLIDDLGLKGKRFGGAMVSEKHANFIINEDNATSEEIESLINIVKEKVKEEYDIDLVLECNIIKWNEL